MDTGIRDRQPGAGPVNKKPFLPHASEKGMALLLTVLIVVLLSILVLDVNERSFLSFARARNSVGSLKAYYIMRSGASAAMGFLERDLKESSIDTLSEEWATEIREFPVGDGVVNIAVTDEASRFNINSIINAQGGRKDEAIERFARLLRKVDIDERLAEKCYDWLLLNRVEASYLFRDSSELLLVPELSREDFGKIEGHVTVYTNRAAANININTVGREVLSSLSPELNQALVEAIIDYRKEHPFKELGDIKKVQGIDDALLQTFSDVLTVKSDNFSIATEVKVSDTVRRGVAVVKRSSGQVKMAAWKEE